VQPGRGVDLRHLAAYLLACPGVGDASEMNVVVRVGATWTWVLSAVCFRGYLEYSPPTADDLRLLSPTRPKRVSRPFDSHHLSEVVRVSTIVIARYF
jgi:hypothetical protein